MFLYILLFLSVVKNHASLFNLPKKPVPSCSNIDIRIEPKNPLPSQEITAIAACVSQESGSTPCPTCSVEDTYLEYDLDNVKTIYDGSRCSTHFRIHAHEEENRTDLRITCRIGNQYFIKSIVVEKSLNNGRCCNSADCMYTSQECIHRVCTCPKGTFFVEAKQDCYQSISNISLFCEVDDQCERFSPGMFCKLGVCSCPPAFDLRTTPSPQCVLKETSSERCKNFSVSISNRFPLFSDVVSAVTSCTSDTLKCNENKLYPDLDFISPDLEIIPTRSVLYYIRTKCVRHVDFIFGKQYGNHSLLSSSLDVTLRYGTPMDESYESIYVHTNNYKGRCRQDRDCQGILQCYSDACYCPLGYEYVPEVRDCFPIVSTLYGSCFYTEQCIFRGSICRQGSCQCQPEFWWDTDSGSCVYEARSLGETCELDRHCKLRDDHSMCSKETCTCNAGWAERKGFCVLTSSYSTSSLLQIGWLNTIAMTAVSLMFGYGKVNSM